MIVGVIFNAYIAGAFYTLILWPCFRGFGDNYNMVKKEGETGLEVVRKGMTAAVFWPVTIAVVLYRTTKKYVVPWLTEEA